MNRMRNVIDRCFHLHRKRWLSKQLGRRWSNDMHAENLAVLGIGNELHETALLTQNAGFRITHEIKLADLHFKPTFFRFLFAQSRPSDRWIRIDARRNMVVV